MGQTLNRAVLGNNHSMRDLFEVELDQEERELYFFQNPENLKQNSYLGLQFCRNLLPLNQVTCEGTEFNTI